MIVALQLHFNKQNLLQKSAFKIQKMRGLMRGLFNLYFKMF